MKRLDREDSLREAKGRIDGLITYIIHRFNKVPNDVKDDLNRLKDVVTIEQISKDIYKANSIEEVKVALDGMNMNKNEFRRMIFEYAIEGVMKIYKFDKETSEKIVYGSGLDWSIEVAPEMVAHCSQEQLVDMVMG